MNLVDYDQYCSNGSQKNENFIDIPMMQFIQYTRSHVHMSSIRMSYARIFRSIGLISLPLFIHAWSSKRTFCPFIREINILSISSQKDNESEIDQQAVDQWKHTNLDNEKRMQTREGKE
jgi:hypothetical protein